MNLSHTKLFFTADTHYFHRLICKYCNRPFESVEQMNDTLIREWNKIVPNDGVAIHLGDFGLAPKLSLKHVFDQLKGYKILLIGNHDKAKSSMLEIGFSEVHKYMEFRKDGKKVFMGHVPMYSSYHDIVLCGHVHTSFLTNGNLLNVGVDKHNWRPISWEEIMVYYKSMSRYKFIPMEIKIDGEN